LWFIAKHFSNARRRHKGIELKVERGERELYRSREARKCEKGPKPKGPPGDNVTFWVETTTLELAKELQKAVNTCGLPWKIREKAGTSMKQAMCRSDVNPLDNQRMTPVVRLVFGEEAYEDARFLQKDCVYRVKCSLCQECYTGETKQRLHKRMYGHWRPLHMCRGNNPQEPRGKEGQESALTEHYLNHHQGEPMKLELVQLAKTSGFVNRKTMEAVVQATTDSTINRRIEGAGTVGNLYL